jgi:hypothetical protein
MHHGYFERNKGEKEKEIKWYKMARWKSFYLLKSRILVKFNELWLIKGVCPLFTTMARCQYDTYQTPNEVSYNIFPSIAEFPDERAGCVDHWGNGGTASDDSTRNCLGVNF